MSSLLVAAIDIGTTFSGYAFSFLHDYKNDKLKISANIWTAGVGKLVSQKTSTCVLFDATGKFHSFGFEAEKEYSNLALDDNHHDWYYFRRFKMMLYDEKVHVQFLVHQSHSGVCRRCVVCRHRALTSSQDNADTTLSTNQTVNQLIFCIIYRVKRREL